MKRLEKHRFSACFLPAALLSAAPCLLAQSVASLTATVTDPSKAVIPAARLELIAESTSRLYSVATNKSGLASFPALLPGPYQLRVTVAGFAESRTNIDAEYGRSSGGQIQLTSRGGTNIYHGSAFDFIRNDYLDAWNPFTKFNNSRGANLTKPKLRLNDFVPGAVASADLR